ncbi:MAG: PHB depolymerase family esterase [Polyangia bacterium]
MRSSSSWLPALFLLVGCARIGVGSTEQSLSPEPAASQFLSGTSSDGRSYKLYVPSSYVGSALPLVVMLHGCTQNPDDFAAGTHMNTVAESEGFLALYPQQSQADNASGCWNWFQPADQVRGAGEPASIVGVIDHVAATYQIDVQHTYALGLSAGGAMAVILGATYPDRFAAIASGEGLEYKAGTSVVGGYNAEMQGGPSPETQGELAFEAMSTNARTVRAFVIEGTVDFTVKPLNGDQTISQWAQTNDLASDGLDDGNIDDIADSTSSGQVPGGHAYTVSTYDDAISGQVVMQKLVVTGMNHAWSGGDASGSFTDPMGPDASKMAWAFFNTGAASLVDGGTSPTGDAATQPHDGAVTPPTSTGTGSTSEKPIPGGCTVGGHAPSSAWPAMLLGLLLFVVSRRRAM